jgi:hypothetical protein
MGPDGDLHCIREVIADGTSFSAIVAASSLLEDCAAAVAMDESIATIAIAGLNARLMIMLRVLRRMHLRYFMQRHSSQAKHLFINVNCA